MGLLKAICGSALALALLAGAPAGAADKTPASKPWYKRAWNPANVRPCDRAGMVINLDVMETFGIRDGEIHEMEAFRS